MRSSVLVPALLVLLSGALIGCSGSGRLTYQGPQDAYEKGVAEMEEGDYQQAIRLFRAVFEYGRGNQWAPKARFKLAMAQRGLNKHLLAANEFQRFAQLYRNNELLPRAEFERANSYYLRSPAYRLDQTDSREAISLFRLFIDRYPNHELGVSALPVDVLQCPEDPGIVPPGHGPVPTGRGDLQVNVDQVQ